MSIPFIKEEPAHEIKDADWVREAFLLSQGEIDATDRFWCTFTSSDQDFQDTRLGGSIAINPYPQFTHFADPCLSSLNRAHRPTNSGSMDSIHSLTDEWGTGHYYHEAFFENQQIIHMQFGHIRFKGVLSFFLGMYDGHAGMLARTGRTSITYWLGKTATTLVTLPLQFYVLAGQAVNFVLGRPTSQYAHLSPAMGSYWNRATMICNAFCTNLKIAPPVWGNSSMNADMLDVDDVEPDDDEREEMLEYAYRKTKGIFKKNGGIDLYLVANGPQRIANRYHEDILNISGEENDNKEAYRRKLMDYITNRKVADPGGIPLSGPGGYLEKYHTAVFGNMDKIDINDIPADIAYEDLSNLSVTSTGTVSTDGSAEAPAAQGPNLNEGIANPMTTSWIPNPASPGIMDRLKGWVSEGREYLKADLDYGSQFVTFRVDDTGPVSEQFTSQTREAELQGTLNGISKSLRSKAYSFSGGNTGIWVVDQAKSAVTGFLTGVLDAVHLSGLYALLGASYVDMPHHWEDSVAQFPTLSYSADLVPASGSDLARLISMYVPVSMMLAAALPMSTGGATYTAPFYCQVYDRGRNIVRLGMIDSLSLEWGITNLGFNNSMKPLACRMTWSIKDCSNILHAPADSGFDILKPWKGVITDDTKFTDYLAMRSSLSMGDMLFPQRKLRLRMTKRAMDYNSFFSRSHFSNAIANSRPAYILAGLFGDAQSMNIRTN